MPRRFFYNSSTTQPLNQYQLGDSIELTTDIHHHWCRVLRAKIGERANLFDGLGGEYAVELVEISKKSASVQLLSFIDSDNTPNITTLIGLVMSRGDRMDYAIQKATEMGVTAIQLLTSQHGEVRLKPAQVEKKLTHWQQVAIAACEQCGMNRVPLVLAPVALSEWVSSEKNISYIQTHLENNINKNIMFSGIIKAIATDSFYQDLSQTADMALVLSVPKNNEINTVQQLKTTLNTPKTPFIKLLIGAEGGLSDDEIKQAKSAGFLPWQIGQRVLRTETAPVVALATLQAWL